MAFKIFTSGKMGGFSYQEQMAWRKELEHKVNNISPQSTTFIHPPTFFDYNSQNQEMAKQWEINQLINSDIVVVNLNEIDKSIGTLMELGIIEGVNRVRDKKIYVVGIGDMYIEHPWLNTTFFKQVSTIDDAAEFIVDYLLI